MNIKIIFLILILFFIINYINCQDSLNEDYDDDPCKDLNLTLPIKKKTGKIFYAYVRPPHNANYTYFAKDPSFKWENIDVIATYISKEGYDKRISCLAHKKGVRVEVILEEGDFCSNAGKDLECPYYEKEINKSLPTIIKKLQTYYFDGISLDFEQGGNYYKYGRNGGYAFLSKYVSNYFNSINPNYSLSSALALNPNSNLYNQMKEIAKYNDYLVIMCYDLFGYSRVGASVTDSPVTSIEIRNHLKYNYINILKDKELVNKVIVALPLYGYEKLCQRNSKGLFNDNCLIENSYDTRNIGVNQIHQNLTKYDDRITTGVIWNDEFKTVYSNIQFLSTGDIYQVVYDTPFSTYLKLKDIGLGGSGVWAIDHLIGLPQPIVESWYVTFERTNIGDKFI